MTSLSLVATGDTILASHHNQAYNLLKGIAGSSEVVTLLDGLRLGASNWATTGVLRLPNNAVGIVSRNAANNADIEMLRLLSDNSMLIGVTTVTAYSFQGGPAAFSGTYVAIGTTPATDGNIRIANDARLTARNAGNTDNHDLIYLNSANVVKVGADGGLNIDIGAGLTGAVTINGASLNVAGSFMQVGTNPATAGVIRLPNGQSIFSRNAANSANLQIAAVDGSNNVQIGDSSVARVQLYGAGVTDFQATGSGVALGGGAAPTLGTIGGSGPAAAAQNSWLKVKIAGTDSFIPIWR